MMSVKKAGLIGAILFMLLLSGCGSQKETKAEEPLDEKAQNAEAQDERYRTTKRRTHNPKYRRVVMILQSISPVM